MKKPLSGFILLIAVTFLFSCKNSSAPSSVASSFMKALVEQDFAAAKKYATSGSAVVLDQIEAASKQMEYPDSLKQIFKQAVYKAKNEKITDTTADIDITVTLPKEIMGIKEQTQTVHLRKEKGAWKVDMEEMMPGTETEMQPSQMPADSSLQPLPTAPDSAEQ